MAAILELKCFDCEGSGKIEIDPLNSFFDISCPHCDGSGLVRHTDIYISSKKEAKLEYDEDQLVSCKILTEEKE